MFEIDQSGKISLLTPVAAGVHRFLGELVLPVVHVVRLHVSFLSNSRCLSMTSSELSFPVLAKSDQGDMDSLSIVLHVTELEKAGPRISSASCGSITVPENQQLKNFKRIVAVNFSNTTRFSIRGRKQGPRVSTVMSDRCTLQDRASSSRSIQPLVSSLAEHSIESSSQSTC